MALGPSKNQVARKVVSASNLLRLQNFPSVPTTPVTLQGAEPQSDKNELNLFKIYDTSTQMPLRVGTVLPNDRMLRI